MAELRDPNSLERESCSALTRRDLLRTLGAGALAASVPLIGRSTSAAAFPQGKTGPSASDLAETAVARFHKSLSKAQREQLCFPFDHPLRSVVKNNWDIVKPAISDMNSEQQALCREIMKNLCSEDGYERFMKQMEDDAGGFDAYHVAVFGEPGTEKPFEWVLTGRHDTLRADGNSLEGAAFGGPIFYGHAADGHFNEDAKHTNNVWWYQGEQANKIFQTFDDKQKARALVTKGEEDDARSIKLKGDKLPDRGMAVADLDGQQKDMVRQLVEMMLRPFRSCDAAEVRQCLDAAGGTDKLRLTYYKEGDIGSDGVWDIWKVEGPAFAWYFRGSPHVHTWLNVARKA